MKYAASFWLGHTCVLAFFLSVSGCGSDDEPPSSSGGAPGNGGNAAGGGSRATGGGAGAASSCELVTPIAQSTCEEGGGNCFSFFVASRARMFELAQAFNGSTKGWGGDFRYGTGDGLRGADKLCTEIAEESLPGNCRTWRAFLSTSKVDAISRVGSGPWYDRLNRTIANDLAELVARRPGGITASAILNNLPNEDGTPHHNEETRCSNLSDCADNHDVLTGSDSAGRFCTAATCGSGPEGVIISPGGGGGGAPSDMHGTHMFMGGGPGIDERPGPPSTGADLDDWTCEDWTLGTAKSGVAPRCGHSWPTGSDRQDPWISHLTENGCAPGFNLVQNSAPNPTGEGSVGDGGGYGAIYCLALSQ